MNKEMIYMSKYHEQKYIRIKDELVGKYGLGLGKIVDDWSSFNPPRVQVIWIVKPDDAKFSTGVIGIDKITVVDDSKACEVVDQIATRLRKYLKNKTLRIAFEVACFNFLKQSQQGFEGSIYAESMFYHDDEGNYITNSYIDSCLYTQFIELTNYLIDTKKGASNGAS